MDTNKRELIIKYIKEILLEIKNSKKEFISEIEKIELKTIELLNSGLLDDFLSNITVYWYLDGLVISISTSPFVYGLIEIKKNSVHLVFENKYNKYININNLEEHSYRIGEFLNNLI